MISQTFTSHALPVVADRAHFDLRSGNWLERVIFNYRAWVLLACALVTLTLAWSAAGLRLNASFEKILPVSHPYIRNYLDHRQDLRALGNVLRVSVENTRGDIFDARYLETLKNINDELFLTPGVDRAWQKSLWTPAVRWSEVTEEGFTGGPVMPDRYDSSPTAIAQLRANIARAGILGSLVARDFKSSVIVVPLLDKDLDTGRRLDYGALSRSIEERVRQRFAGAADAGVRIQVIGFAKLIGDLIEGVAQMQLYFGVAFLIAAVLIYWHTRCARSTLLLLACSLVAVVWQLGVIALP